jgi:translation initiation factor 2A
MPAKTTLFDQRVQTLHDFGSSPHNYISFNPQGRLVALAGFGNLAGKIDIFDRKTLTKICAIDAPNTSFCEWSPCGRFLLTATLSPRLRVDNGIKVWHCTGGLMHVQMVEELYQASWRPTPLDQAPAFGPTIPVAPQPSLSVLTAALTAKPIAAKPAGAYRPPGARGLATPAIFKREDEGGAPRMPTGSGSATPPRRGPNRSPNPPGSMGYANGTSTPPNGNGNGHYQNGNGRQRNVPGAPPKTPSAVGGGVGSEKAKKKGKKREKASGEAGSGAATPTGAAGEASVRPSIDVTVQVNGTQTPGQSSVPPTPGAESLDPVAKKVRNLNKKAGVFFFPFWLHYAYCCWLS